MRNRIRPGCLVILFSLLPDAGLALSGRDIVEDQKARHESLSEETATIMTLRDARGRERTRRMVSYLKKTEDGHYRTLIKFTSPTDVRDVGLLTWEQGADQEDDQWLYLPAARQVKRIAGSGKKSKFMGTDLAYEDLRPENLDSHAYQLLGEEDVDGHPCWKIEAAPNTEKERRDSGYSRRVLWIRQDIVYTVKAEFYNRRGKLEKKSVSTELERVRGEMWRSGRSVMTREREGTSTTMRTESRRLNPALDDGLFTQRGLRRPVSE